MAAPLLVGLLLSSHSAFGRDDASIEPIGSLVPDESLDPRILALELDGRSWHDAVADLDSALFEHRRAERGLQRAAEELIDVRSSLALVTSTHTDTELVAAQLEADIAEARALLEASAIAQFVRTGEAESDVLSSADSATEESRRLQLTAEARDVHVNLWRGLTERVEQISGELSELGGRRLELATREQALVSHITAASTSLPLLAAEIDAAMEQVREIRRDASIPDIDIPVTALDAYMKAETLLAETQPDCGLEWWMIAGVGRIESRHGELGGRRLADNGRTTPEIIGIALDGGPNVRAVIDTDGGELDGDAVWDRAVGPMQFIPETWSIRGRDGNGDGVADPHNIYDSAYTTGRYLCRLGDNLTTDFGRDRAYFGYNTSDEYVDDVSHHAERYRDILSDRLETS